MDNYLPRSRSEAQFVFRNVGPTRSFIFLLGYVRCCAFGLGVRSQRSSAVDVLTVVEQLYPGMKIDGGVSRMAAQENKRTPQRP